MNKLSSDFTFMFKYVFPVGLTLFSIGSLAFPDTNHTDVLITAGVNVIFWPLWYLYAAKAKVVYLDGESLLVKEGKKMKRISFSQIASISQERWVNTKNVELKLKTGEEFYFIPDDLMNIMRESPIVELIRSNISKASTRHLR